MELEIGQEIDGRYVIVGEIGAGGIARVYAANDTRLGVPVALKLLMVPAASARKRMQREGRAQASLRHPNVVQVTDIIDVHGTLGLVMDLVRGPSLAELVARHRLTVDEAVALAHGIVSGVKAAHALGLVHRDIKPHNVLLHTEGTRVIPRVADFGLVKAVASDDPSSTVTRTGATMGSPRYMSPEQVRDASKVDHRTDLFSLGCVIYEMLCAAPTFPGEDTWEVFNAIMAGDFQAPRELAVLPDHIAAAVESCLEPDLTRRMASCDALLEALGEPEADPWRPETLSAIAAFVEQLPGLELPEAETWQGTLHTQEREPATPAVLPLPAPKPRPKPKGSTLNIALLEGASDRDRIMALRHLKPARVPADTMLMEEGDLDPSLLVLLEGAVELRRGDVDIGEAGPGDLVGASDLLTGEPRFATVRTLEDTKLLVLHAAGFGALTAAGNHVAHAIELAAVVQMARRLRSMESALALVAPPAPMPEIATEGEAGFFGRLRGAVRGAEPEHRIDIGATLRLHPALRESPAGVLAPIVDAFHEAHAKPGTPIFSSGGPTRRLYVHGSGRVRAVLPVGDRGVTLLESPEPGWPLGAAALFDEVPHRWSAIAETSVHVLVMESDQWQALLERPDEVGSAFRQWLVHALRRRYVAMMAEAVGTRSPGERQPTPRSPG